MAYKIQTEGRELKEVIKVGRTVRIDLGYKTTLRNVSELKDFVFQSKRGHNLPNGIRVCYVKVLSVKEIEPVQKIPSSKKRYVLKNAIELGIDSGYVDEKTGRFVPTWYIFDKQLNDIAPGEAAEGPGAKATLKKIADNYNRG